MNTQKLNTTFRMEVTRESFLGACTLFRKTVRSKRDQDEDVIFCLGESGFSASWGNTSIDLSAKGVWPVAVSIPGKVFLAVVKFPPSADPLVIEIKDGRFFCGGLACQFYFDESSPDLFSPEAMQPVVPPSKPPKVANRKPEALPSPSPLPQKIIPPQKLSQPTNMARPVRNILDDLENIRENLLAFSDDVWLNIEHNDAQALDEGIVFKRRLNEQIDAFGRLSDGLTRLIQEYTQVQTEGEASAGSEVGGSSTENSRIIKDLNQNEPHSLSEDFTYKRPCGFILDGVGYQDINTWSRVYELVLRQLEKKDSATYRALPENPQTITRRDNRHFSRNPGDLRKALAIPDGLSAEINLSANHICASIRTLLKIFSLPETSLILFLRQDRDA